MEQERGSRPVLHKFFAFLSDDDTELLTSIIKKRSPELMSEFSTANWEDFDDNGKLRIIESIVDDVLGDEFMDNLDEGWEPTAYGKEVHSLLNRINVERIGVNDRLRESDA
ncbi:hypothetical protein [Mycobacteroides abscessus]|uniref:hypothetical protein n=1 Tax=Mycobacteroides abscessus TaxID=36809 RepID=UPI000925D5AB|nr:hypothetical protein [Mycobacteroides abscessus]SHP70241.1 Uncharacterised protein [Mycobacteroides abscessus subsp. bolletii]SHS16054.1 Uncharacterised protein [Mycobacteroides abscessus subsp. bolletii]SHS89186.1 Uncharacterised protein [Mycobacteroides abscessus subsp. bolletii]SKF65681.1 Uncharacterised protein [Mycobacteroides abscessus subsp. bolletii]SKG28955.1 Uncharacterised protein [Mycobacteroides abscessus subsp. bolletii]